MTDYSLDRIAEDVIEKLEVRLQRIEYVTSGHLNGGILRDDNQSVIIRLGDLEQIFLKVVSSSKVIQDLLKLYVRHPVLFDAAEEWEAPSSLDTASRSSMVLAAASAFHQTASRLTSVNDTPLPTAEASTRLIDAAVEVAKVEVSQEFQSREIASLKERTAAVLQRWYAIDIIDMGDCWANLETRVQSVEQAIRRAKAMKQQDEAIN